MVVVHRTPPLEFVQLEAEAGFVSRPVAKHCSLRVARIPASENDLFRFVHGCSGRYRRRKHPIRHSVN
jgi:hypothetical protein